jgi:hypothetical protein
VDIYTSCSEVYVNFVYISYVSEQWNMLIFLINKYRHRLCNVNAIHYVSLILETIPLIAPFYNCIFNEKTYADDRLPCTSCIPGVSGKRDKPLFLIILISAAEIAAKQFLVNKRVSFLS